MEWGIYEDLLGIKRNGSLKEIAANNALDAFMNGIIDDPAYQEDTIINGCVMPLVADRVSTIKCSIQALPGTNINIGDIVQCYCEHWIVMELFIDKIGIMRGEMWLCNGIIPFQDRLHNVCSRYCVIDDGTYSKRSSNGDVYTPLNGYNVYIPLDDETKFLHVDKRIAVNKMYNSNGEEILNVYKIYGIDNKSRNFGEGSHLSILQIQSDVYNENTDNIENMICDEYHSGDDSLPSEGGSCVISGRDTQRVGTSRRYVAEFMDANGNVVNVNPVWEIINGDPKSGITHTTSGNTCEVNIPMNNSLVGSSILINVRGDEDRYGTYKKEVQVIALG